MSHTRQLVAIMFTDIQGYTAMMQRDEALTIKIRERHRKIFNYTTEEFNGKIVQYFGDGTLSTFTSAIDAVKCAMEMQMAFQKEPVIPVRIGIHLGDIVYTEDDIIGDGVNVASRIESLAVPGSVFISDKVYDEIKNQSSIETISLKTFELKNVDRPIEVFAISNKGLIIPNANEITGKTKDTKSNSIKSEEKKQHEDRKKKLNWILYSLIGLIVLVAAYFIYQNSDLFEPKIDDLDKSIAVLAFENMSNDPNQEYFSDGISEEILNSLVKVKGLKVAGRTSS
ncbi:MAG: adenylate/guanylate cyclase domain-containing protein, partial [Cyclobacteriaceae bacterium]|nr:adenylate/guanylate cyclase domain-containing protein [Cyclobacteriaceae bacterium]